MNLELNPSDIAVFPDLPHFTQVQKDLWKWPVARAAVLVGAGLSLNAEPLPGVTSSFPTWWQLVRAMFDEVYPDHPGATPDERFARERRFEGASHLRVASEYEAAFGRRKLELLIAARNPDASFQPGKLHTLLLQLPWADVFTTNYDTLLERTEVPGRAYQPVIKASALTTAFAPRIVKLHGSLPSQSPFIITEEDFRSYPRKFAPFVNTVQQGLLENSLVLIGFSGDDPNFLEWTGWIRDELGNEHPPVYLVGALSLTPPQRSLLQQRGVTPIDLTPVFRGRNPPQGLHRAALEWFLTNLLAARTPRPEAWPDLDDVRTTSRLVGCPPLLAAETAPPVEPPLFPNPKKPLDLPTVKTVIARWQFDRCRYSGWLVLPHGKREGLRLRTKYWIAPLLNFAASWNFADRLIVLYEIYWRWETSMSPLPQELLPIIQEVLEGSAGEIAAGRGLLSSHLNARGMDWSKEWFALAFALMREAREEYAGAQWEVAKTRVEQVLPQYPAYSDRAAYENALWQIWNVDHDRALETLNQWKPSQQSPLATMWKAGLLGELDEWGEARTLLLGALSEIRNALRKQGNNIELLSLEGWCTYVLLSVEVVADRKGGHLKREEFRQRWDELKAFDCSPWPEKEFFSEALAKAPPERFAESSVVQGFDPGHSSVTQHWRDDKLEPYLPAFGYIRLHERAGLPLRLGNLDMTGAALGNAVRWLETFRPFAAMALLVRAGKRDEFKGGSSLSRPVLAGMDPDLVASCIEWCFQGFERLVTKISRTSLLQDSGSERLVGTLVEVLSRFSVRADEAQLRKIFPLVLRFHGLPAVRMHITWNDVCDSWFKRLYEGATGSLLLEWLPALLRFPLFNEECPERLRHGSTWPDPMRHFPIGRARDAAGDFSNLKAPILEAAAWLVRRATSESGEARERALLRLATAYEGRFLATKLNQELAELLWKERTPTGLPQVANFAMFGFLHLPAPDRVNVKAAIKKQILSLSSQGMVEVTGDEYKVHVRNWWVQPLIEEAIMASKAIIHVRGEALGEIKWTRTEAQTLYDQARAWWNADKIVFAKQSGVERRFRSGVDPILNTLDAIGPFLSRAVIPYARIGSRLVAEMMAWVLEAREVGGFPTIVLPYLVMQENTLGSRCEMMLAEDLAPTSKFRAVASAVKTMRHWLALADAGRVPEPPRALLATLIQRVVFRRQTAALPCLVGLASILKDMPHRVEATQAQLLEASLTSWEGVTRPSSDADSEEIPVEQRPDLRTTVAGLGKALEDWFEKNEADDYAAGRHEGIKLWREVCARSVLPELRRVFDGAATVDGEVAPSQLATRHPRGVGKGKRGPRASGRRVGLLQTGKK